MLVLITLIGEAALMTMELNPKYEIWLALNGRWDSEFNRDYTVPYKEIQLLQQLRAQCYEIARPFQTMIERIYSFDCSVSLIFEGGRVVEINRSQQKEVEQIRRAMASALTAHIKKFMENHPQILRRLGLIP